MLERKSSVKRVKTFSNERRISPRSHVVARKKKKFLFLHSLLVHGMCGVSCVCHRFVFRYNGVCALSSVFYIYKYCQCRCYYCSVDGVFCMCLLSLYKLERIKKKRHAIYISHQHFYIYIHIQGL